MCIYIYIIQLVLYAKLQEHLVFTHLYIIFAHIYIIFSILQMYEKNKDDILKSEFL